MMPPSLRSTWRRPKAEWAGAVTQPTFAHTTVLLQEVVDALRPRPHVAYRALDATVGGGGHSHALLERSAPDGVVVALDADPVALAAAGERLQPFEGRVELLQRNFRDLADLHPEPLDGIVFDLGLSSPQLESSGRGFSFSKADEPLDMRFDPAGQQPTAADLLNLEPEAELERIFREYGEEPRARRLARIVAEQRARQQIQTTGDFVKVVERALGPKRGRIHPATRPFQALRIAVNEELTSLETALDAAINLLKPTGRIAVISFHSLEDRIVKWRFRGWAESAQATVLTKKPITPSAEEIERNPRARSAKLRVAERLAS